MKYLIFNTFMMYKGIHIITLMINAEVNVKYLWH